MLLQSHLANLHMRKYLILLAMCSVLGVLFYLFLHYSETGSFPFLEDHAGRIALAALLTTVIGAMVVTVDTLLDRVLSWRAFFMARFLAGFLANMVLAIGLLTAGSQYFHLGKEALIKLSILFAISIFLYEVFYGWFYSYRYYAHTQVDKLRADRWQLELQFESLRNQISPHYLFNCLNTISSLLYKDSHTAEKFIRRMADTFRYVLGNQKQKLVALREELEFVKAYYYLLQVRYDHHLQLEINVPNNVLDTPIPPLTLQLLVENAVKHNQISKDMPLLVYITARDNTHLVISNTKTVQQIVPGFKVGMENIRQRYQFFTSEKISIRNENKFVVELPVLKQPVENRKAV
jgi:two-component system, LytTR family, sensor kinase